LELKAIGSLSNIALSTLLGYYQDPSSYKNEVAFETMWYNETLAAQLVDVWAWIFFALNTSMTMSIIYKIL
jgi:hypothetical protein